MPVALDPDQTFRVILESDRGKPKAPYFTFRFLSNRDWKKVAALEERIEELAQADVGQLLGEIEDALRIALVGWGNMMDPVSGKAIRYDPTDLDRIVNPAEVNELFFALMEHVELTDADKKKLGSRSLKPSGKSVKSARRRKRVSARRVKRSQRS